MQSTLDRSTEPLQESFAPRIRILRAAHMGMCFGVRDAIALAREKARSGPLTILGELVHNESVLGDLRRVGVTVETDLKKVGTRQAMITAHGASEKRIAAARAEGFDLSEATCPLVHFAHRSVRQLVAEGFHPVIIGKRDHVEVRGMTEDLAEYDVVLTEADVDGLAERTRFGLAAQTTQPIAKVQALVERLRRRFPAAEVKFVDTVCQPTKQRQRAAEELGQSCDIVVVVGGANSNNTRELAQTCGKHCAEVHHVHGPDDVRSEWFRQGLTVGITAGTSTPDYLIDAVEQRIQEVA